MIKSKIRKSRPPEGLSWTWFRNEGKGTGITPPTGKGRGERKKKSTASYPTGIAGECSKKRWEGKKPPDESTQEKKVGRGLY